jgi:hypothetical protein
MATRSAKINETDLQAAVQEEIQALLAEDTITSETLNPALQSLYVELGMEGECEATVFVSHKTKSEPEASIWRGDPDAYDLPTLAKKFGSGEYRVKVYVRQPDGKRVCRANKVFPWKLSAEDEERLANGGVKSPVLTQGDIAVAVAEAMKGILPAMQQPAQQINPMDQMKIMLEMAKAMTPPPAPQIDQMAMMRNTIEMMQLMKEERGEDEPRSRGEKAGSWDAVLALINKFGPLAAGMLQQQMVQQGSETPAYQDPLPQLENTPTATPPAPVSPVVNGSMNVVAEKQQESDEMFAKQQLKLGIGFLLNGCKQGGSAQSYADMVIDNVPIETLDAMMAQPDPYQVLLTAAPEIAPHEAWFRELLGEVKTILTVPPEA